MLKIGLLGCGTMGATHSSAYQHLEMCQVVAVCDIRHERATLAATAHQATIYDNFTEMLKQEELDIIDICLPTYLHKEYALQAMTHKKHVFCEKPVALTNEDALELVAFSKQQQVKFAVGHVLRFFPSYQAAASRFHEDDLGQVKLIRTSRNQAFPQWSWEGWFSDYAKSGGPFVDLLIHDIDWLLANFGEVERVYAKSYSREITGQDHCIAVLRMKNGAIAHLEGSWAYPAGSEFKMSYELVGTKGQVAYDNLADSSIQLQTNKDKQFQASRLSPVAQHLEPYRLELASFMSSIIDNTAEEVSGTIAAKALEVALAAKKSAETGQPITLN